MDAIKPVTEQTSRELTPIRGSESVPSSGKKVTTDDCIKLSRFNKGKLPLPSSPLVQAVAKPRKAGMGEDKAEKATTEKAEAERTTRPLREKTL
jgi:hypothetical protein